jgi:hypothetical protein
VIALFREEEKPTSHSNEFYWCAEDCRLRMSKSKNGAPARELIKILSRLGFFKVISV